MVRVVFPKSTKVIIKLVEQASHWALFPLIYCTKARQSFLRAATLRNDYSVTWPHDAGDFFIFSAAVVCFTLDTWSSVHSWRNGACGGFCSVSSSYHLSLSRSRFCLTLRHWQFPVSLLHHQELHKTSENSFNTPHCSWIKAATKSDSTSYCSVMGSILQQARFQLERWCFFGFSYYNA